MIKNNFAFKWEDKQREYFKNIKETIVQAPTLMSPDFEKEFILYTFASDCSYEGVLTQKNPEGFKVPIYFMTSRLQGVKLKYHDIDKYAYVVFKEIKYFRPYILKFHTKFIVLHPSIINMLVQK
jgi:hypothetical protein